RITIGDRKSSLDKGKTIVMPAGIPHAVAADGKFKMLLTVVFSQP
ncbi:MAG: cupin domain-containing protein, partial [Oscillospiraceae bacterium]|nr:cupin domain-containing protein [Oscillospiraceae bacterium]